MVVYIESPIDKIVDCHFREPDGVPPHFYSGHLEQGASSSINGVPQGEWLDIGTNVTSVSGNLFVDPYIRISQGGSFNATFSGHMGVGVGGMVSMEAALRFVGPVEILYATTGPQMLDDSMGPFFFSLQASATGAPSGFELDEFFSVSPAWRVIGASSIQGSIVGSWIVDVA